MNKQPRENGSALVIALLFVAVFSALAVGYVSAANATLRSTELYVNSRRAHLAAESGLAFARNLMPTLDVQAGATQEETLQAIADQLNAQYQETLFHGSVAVVENDAVILPPLILNFSDGSQQAHLRVVATSERAFAVESVGQHGDCEKSIACNFLAENNTWILSAFGIASRSPITMTGNPDIGGANDSLEGSILSTTRSVSTAVRLTGNISISGDVCASNPAASISITGNADIGGQIRIGVPEPAFPDIDTSIFERFATNIVDSSTKTSGNRYFENIRVLAHTNPTFTGNTTIRGVVYIESPNRVQFTGNLDIIGTVVVEEPEGPLDLSTHYIKFTGNCTTNGVAALPSGAQFDDLRNLTGSFILAPGYMVEFSGNFSTINGTIVASQFKFTGNASGRILGSVLNYDDTDFVMTGNSRLIIDHNGMDDDPAGLIFPRRLAYIRGSYAE